MIKRQQESKHCLKKIMAQLAEARSKTIFGKKLCYGCLEGIRTIIMPTSIPTEGHAKSVNLTWSKTYQTDKINVKNAKKNDEQNDEMKCASINTGSDVVKCIVPEKVRRKE